MDQEQFERELAGIQALKDGFAEKLAAIDSGSTDAQIAKTTPRDPADVAATTKRHEEAARESAEAEAQAYMDSVVAILTTLAAAAK